MTQTGHVIAAYAIGLGLMLGYAILLWLEGRALGRRQRSSGGRP